MHLTRKLFGLTLGLAAFIYILLFTNLDPANPNVSRTLAVASLMAIWWVSEAIPLSITALVPLVLFPAMGILDGSEVSTAYMSHIIFIFIGGFIMALAMEKWNLHKRIAMKILVISGVSPGRILTGFMLATAFLSMWISNTATTMMMIPIVMSVVGSIEENTSEKAISRFATGLLLAVAYSASVGGMATLVGSPTNLVCPRILTMLYPDAPEISFTDWMMFALPISLIMLVAIWLTIYLIYRPKKKWTGIKASHFKDQYRELGRASSEEKTVFGLFLALALMWIFRAGITFDKFTIPGWTSLFGEPGFINDGTVAMFIGILLFILPSRSKKGQRLMDIETIMKLPWNIVLLFGGGFALAKGIQSSGLALWFGEQLSWTSVISPILILLSVVALMSFLTELTTNVASTEMLLPIFAILAVSSGNNPLFLMIPATIASSLAFMMPTATPPNAIIFGTNRLSIKTMVQTGFLLNMMGILLVSIITILFGAGVFDIELGKVPVWVN
jgi:solute carrier family 13 (sodium-dependent dicarboxylate transporter), member 2/3/5